MELEEIISSTEQIARDKERKKEQEKASKLQQSVNDKSATPNLGAWLKAFGVPEKQKKSTDDDSKRADKIGKESQPTNSSAIISLSTTSGKI